MTLPHTPTAPSTLDALLREGADRARGGDAIAAPGRAGLAAAALPSQVESVGAALRAMGIAREDRVALALPNGPAAATAFLGVASACACAPLDPRGRADDVAADLAAVGARAIVVEAGAGTAAREAARRLGVDVVELDAGDGALAGVFTLRGPARPPAPARDARPGDVALLLRTSGTTAGPKLVPLTHANLCASAAHIVATLALDAADTGLAVMPLFHIHGLVAGVLAPLAAGGRVVCAPDFAPAAFFDWIDQSRATWYTAVPTMHQAIVARAPQAADAVARARLRFVRSSSSPLPPATLEALEALWRAPVVEAYGMTEAAHQVTCNPLPPGRRKPGTVGPAAGPEVAVLGADGHPLAPGAVGEVAIRGPNVTAGYLGASDGNADAFVRGWLRTGDEGRLDEDGYLTLTGRLKEMVNRGGEKIAPREIDDALAAHPAVAQAVAFPRPHPTLGEDLAVAVVLRPGALADGAALRAFLAGRLPDSRMPGEILVVDAIPLGPSGKPRRHDLADALGDRQAARAPDEATDAIESALATIVASVLGRDEVGVDDNFFVLGGDSLRGMELTQAIESAFGVDLGAAAVFRHPSVRELAQALRERNTGA